MNNLRVMLGGVPVVGVLDVRLSKESGAGWERRFASVSVAPDCTVLGCLDLTRTIQITRSDSDEVVFTGVIVDASLRDSRYHMSCSDYSQLLTESPAGAIAGSPGGEITGQECVYYLLAFMNEEQAARASIMTGDGTRIQDQPPLSEEREHVVIIPLPNCSLPNGDVTIGRGLIYEAKRRAGRDEDILRSCAARHPKLTNGIHVRFRVRATGLYDAIQKGAVLHDRLWDYLSFAGHLGVPCLDFSGAPLFRQYARRHAVTGPTRPAWLYARDVQRPTGFWLRFDVPRRELEDMRLGHDGPAIADYPIISPLLGRDEDSLAAQDRRQLSALHSLHAARRTAVAEEAIIHLWNAIEFLVGGEKADALFTDADIEAIKKAIRVAAPDVLPSSSRDSQVTRLEDVISRSNEAPLRRRWNQMCARLGCALSEDEERAWAELRKARNSLQHGKPHKAGWQVIDRGLAMVSRVTLHQLMASAASPPTSTAG